VADQPPDTTFLLPVQWRSSSRRDRSSVLPARPPLGAAADAARRRIRRPPSSLCGLFQCGGRGGGSGFTLPPSPPSCIFLDSTVVLVLGLAMAVQVEVQVAVLVPASGDGRLWWRCWCWRAKVEVEVLVAVRAVVAAAEASRWGPGRPDGGPAGRRIRFFFVFENALCRELASLTACLSRGDVLWLSAKGPLPAQQCRVAVAESSLSAQPVPRGFRPVPRASGSRQNHGFR
jgi:hypothetical protein